MSIKKRIWRAVIEVGFIIFLFYSNVSMREFERSEMGMNRGLPGQSQTSLRPPILRSSY